MKRLLVLGCVLLLSTRCASAQSAAAKAEKRLADLLSPGSGIAAGAFAAKPVAWKASSRLDQFALALKPIAGAPVRLPLAPVRGIKPRGASEGIPLVSYRGQPKGPQDVTLPTKPLIKLPSLDVHTPLPIPILALPVKDRASLGDPALAASLEAAMKNITPTRNRPVAFAPLNLPDPFENVRYGQLRNPPDENPMPPNIPLLKPTAK